MKSSGGGERFEGGFLKPCGTTSDVTDFTLKGETSTNRSRVKQSTLAGAVEAALDRKAQNLVVLDLAGICSFTDSFVICNGTSSRQNQAIADAIAERLKHEGSRPTHVEGYSEAEWILMDCVDFVVHIFSSRAREFYDLERLWRAGKRHDAEEFLATRAV